MTMCNLFFAALFTKRGSYRSNIIFMYQYINHSDLEYPTSEIWIHLPWPTMIFKIINIFIVAIFGLFSNSMLVRLIFLHKNLHTPVYIMVANMATSNFMALLICPPLFLVSDLFQNYILGPVGCMFDNLLTPAFLTTSVLNLCAISYDRLTSIALPNALRINMIMAKLICVLTWTIGFVIASPLAIYRDYKVTQWRNFVETYCLEDKLLNIYWYTLLAVMVWIPLVVLITCFAIICIKLDRFEKRLLAREHPIIVSYKWIVSKNLFIMIVIFLFMRLPYTIVTLLRHTTNLGVTSQMSEPYSTLWYLAQLLMYANSSINPILYGFRNEQIRSAYKQTPLCRCSCFNSILRVKNRDTNRRVMHNIIT